MEIFTLFTTKDWPFQSPAKTNDPHKPSHETRNLSTGKPLRSRADTIDGMLFFDRLMQLGSIDNFKDLYPPPHPSRLRQLLDSIDSCSFDLLKKNCLVYYLLKEYGDGRETRFAIYRLIPTHFTRGLDGLWALDHSDWKAAVQCMSDPTVTPDFLPEIIRTLATQPPAKLRSHYLMKFYMLTQPFLELPSIELVLRAMCTNSHIRSAWTLQRSYDRPDRDRLLRIMFETCFGLNDVRQPLSDSLQLLIAYPFDELEDSVLSRFALDAPKILPEAHSMVVIHFYLSKLTAEARYVDAIRFERALSESTQLGSNPDIDRIIRGIVEILPEVQRNKLELEFDQQHPILNQAQTSPGKVQNASDEMDMSDSYDVCSLAWDRPPSPPVLPPPSSLAEARSQQELLNPPKTAIDRTSLPLSASPIFRRAMPRMSLDKSNVSQKVLLKALAYTRQPSAPNSPNFNQTPRSTIDPMDDHQEDSTIISPTAPSHPTPRFQHFSGPSSRLPPSATKPPPAQPNFSTSFSRSTVTTAGSPFHRLSFPDAAAAQSEKASPKSGEERWPTRIVFTPRRPPSHSQRKLEERSIISRQSMNRSGGTTAHQNRSKRIEQVRSSKPVVSDSSSDDNDQADSQDEEEDEGGVATNQKATIVKQFTAVVVPSRDQNKHREMKSPPKKMARVNQDSFKENSRTKVLPGGFQMDDEEMEGPSAPATLEDQNSNPVAPNPSNETSSTGRKRGKSSNNTAIKVVPITPRRSTRLHSNTPAKSSRRLILPGAMIDHDLTEEDDIPLPAKLPPPTSLNPKPHSKSSKKKNTSRN